MDKYILTPNVIISILINVENAKIDIKIIVYLTS